MQVIRYDSLHSPTVLCLLRVLILYWIERYLILKYIFQDAVTSSQTLSLSLNLLQKLTSNLYIAPISGSVLLILVRHLLRLLHLTFLTAPVWSEGLFELLFVPKNDSSMIHLH